MSQGTFPNAVNIEGTVVGVYYDAAGVLHGFIDSDGRFTTVDAPGAGTGAERGTYSDGISDAGLVDGEVLDANNLYSGWLEAGGQFTALNDPDAGDGAYQSAGATARPVSERTVREPSRLNVEVPPTCTRPSRNPGRCLRADACSVTNPIARPATSAAEPRRRRYSRS